MLISGTLDWANVSNWKPPSLKWICLRILNQKRTGLHTTNITLKRYPLQYMKRKKDLGITGCPANIASIPPSEAIYTLHE